MPRVGSRPSRRSSRGGPARRKTAWMGGITQPSILTPGSQTITNLTSELLDVTNTPIARQGLTLLRMFATLRVNSTDASLSVEFSFGFIMSEGDAVIAGAVPDPELDVDAPWTYWERRVALPPSDSQQHLMIDSKSKRIFRGNDSSLILILANDDAAQSLEFVLGFRLLLGLP